MLSLICESRSVVVLVCLGLFADFLLSASRRSRFAESSSSDALYLSCLSMGDMGVLVGVLAIGICW